MPLKGKPKRKHAHLHRWARIDRAGAMHAARVHLGAAYELLDADADFGLYVLQQAFAIREETRPSLTSFASLVLFHRATELIDGLSVLVKAGCAVPTTPLLRSLLEAVMSARYLMTVNDERVAACYLSSRQLTEMANFLERAAKHAAGSAPTLVAREGRKKMDDAVAEDRIFREARQELERMNQLTSVPGTWFQAFGGPHTLGGLSGRIKDEALEEFFARNYDPWSAATHVSDATHALMPSTSVSDTPNLLTPLRSPSARDITLAVRWAHQLFLFLLTHHLQYFRVMLAGMDEYRAIESRLILCLDP